MEILSNKKELFNLFESIYKEIMDVDEKKISTITLDIKDKMISLGARIFETWFSEKIGNGYQGYKTIDSEGMPYKFHKNLERYYLTCLGEVKLSRSYYTSKAGGFFPIEKKHNWLKEEFFPDIKELACYVSMLEPYEMASEMIKKIGRLSISSSSLQKIAKNIGNRLVEKEDKAVESGKTDHVKDPPDLLVISCDGACINTDNGWKEVKNGAVYQLKEAKEGLKAYNQSYVSRIEVCENFGKRLFLEARRRNVSFAKKVVVIGDGAKWIWEMSGKYYPNSVEIVDWYHATEHLWEITELLYGNRENEKGKEFEEKAEDLLYSGFIELLKNIIHEKIKELNIDEKPDRYNDIIKAINYFINNEKRMKYEYFEQQKYPIGSGVIEGACKHLVQIRMKRNGMKWSYNGAHDILQLRCLYKSNRWNEVQDEINAAA